PSAHGAVRPVPRVHGDQPVAARRPRAGGDRADQRRVGREGQAAGLDHHEVVARAVHLEERTAHGRAYKGLGGKMRRGRVARMRIPLLAVTLALFALPVAADPVTVTVRDKGVKTTCAEEDNVYAT